MIDVRADQRQQIVVDRQSNGRFLALIHNHLPTALKLDEHELG